MEGISAEEQIPHVHARERIVEQSVNVIVPPIMVGISESEPITPRVHFKQSVIIVPLTIEGISAAEQITIMNTFKHECRRASHQGGNPGLCENYTSRTRSRTDRGTECECYRASDGGGNLG